MTRLTSMIRRLRKRIVMNMRNTALYKRKITKAKPNTILTKLALELITITLPTTRIRLGSIRQTLRRITLKTNTRPNNIHPLMTNRIHHTKDNSQERLQRRHMKIYLMRTLTHNNLCSMLVRLAYSGTKSRTLPSTSNNNTKRIVNTLIPIIRLTSSNSKTRIENPSNGIMTVLTKNIHNKITTRLLMTTMPLTYTRRM